MGSNHVLVLVNQNRFDARSAEINAEIHGGRSFIMAASCAAGYDVRRCSRPENGGDPSFEGLAPAMKDPGSRESRVTIG